MTRDRSACLVGAVVTAGLLSLPSVLAGEQSDQSRIRLITLVLVHVTWCVVESMSVGTGRRLTAERYRARWLPPSIAGGMLLVTGLAAIRVAAPRSTGAAAPAELAAACVFGAGIAGFGIVLRSLAIRRLGPRFLDAVAVGTTGHTLERDGVFGRCRHPAELGFLLILLGTAVLSGSVPALMTWLLVIVPVVVYRARLEDRLLVTHFGADAVAYQMAVTAFGISPRPQEEQRPPHVRQGNEREDRPGPHPVTRECRAPG